jgi:hypothetical protein
MTSKISVPRRAAWLTATALLFGCSSNVDLAGERQRTNSSGGGDAGETVSTGGGGGGEIASSGGATSSGGHAGEAISTGGGPSGGANAGGATAGGGSGGIPAPADAGCHSGPTPLDFYLMVDQSSSLTAAVPSSNPPITWWQAVEEGIATFVQSPAVAGVGVGIQFFPYGGSIEGPDPNAPSSSCYVPNYVTPEVEIATLPGNAPAIIQAIGNHSPTTFTPTEAALRGAVEHMKAWGPAHPGRQPAVVLVTDGFPTECDPQDPLLIAQIAKEAFDNDPKVMTFVVGLETGGSLSNLNSIAQAGGTGQVHLVQFAGELARDMIEITTTAPMCP